MREFILSQFRKLGYDLKIKPFRTTLDDKAIDKASQILGKAVEPPIFIHPGSGGIHKVWPLKNWHALLAFLRGSFPEIPVVISLGPAEEKLVTPIKSLTERYGIKILPQVDLETLAACISLSRLYIGCDSGVTHLAATTGTPVIAIFGPTNPSVWAPYAENVTTIRSSWTREEVLSFTEAPMAQLPAEIVETLTSIISQREFLG